MKLSNILLSAMLVLGASTHAFAQDGYEPVSLLVRADIDKARSTEKWAWTQEAGLRLKGSPEYKNAFWVYPKKIAANGTLRASFIV